MSCENCNAQKQLELPLESPAAAFAMNWATYRDGQTSMLNGIVSYLEMTGHPGVAKRVKDRFGNSSS